MRVPFFRILVSRSGSAVIQAALGLALVGGLGAIIMKSNEESAKQAKTNFLTEDMEDLSSQIQRLLSSSAACTQTFAGQNARNSGIVTAVKDHTGASVLTTATRFGTGNVGFESIRLREPNDPSDGQVVTGGTGTTYAEVKFINIAKSGYQEKNKLVKIRLRAETDGTDTVIRCFSMNANDTLWAREGATDNINYSPGNVGIGVTDPQDKLDVSGAALPVTSAQAIAATTSDSKKFTVGGSPTRFEFNLTDNLPLLFRAESGTALAKLEVKDAVAEKSLILTPVSTGPGVPSGVPCGAALEGAMRMREIFIRPQAHGQAGLTIVRTQVCSDYGGVWKWRTLKLQRYTRATGAPCTPGLTQKDCTDHNSNSPHQ